MHDVTTLAPAGANDIVLAKLYDARPETVWAALTDARALAAWWGPDGCTITTREADIRPGGQWRYALTTPEGTVFENRHKYEELEPHVRIIYRQGERPEDDNAVRVTISLAAHGRATMLTLRIEFSSQAWRDNLIPRGAVTYPAQSLAHLAGYLEDH
jgi:uncharacterized protein YndB with AHSA1/START domain